jgi:hypothetical protein
MVLVNLAVIILFMMLMLYFAFLEVRSYRTGYRDYRSLIVSLGLLGTFTGIVLGLWDFDTHEIRSSVPQLLDGLKTAFITSIAGMALSIALGAYERMHSPAEAKATEPSQPPQSQEPLLRSLISEITQLRQQLQEQSASQHRETLQQMRRGFDTLDATMAQSGAAAVIEALQSTMSEFNDHLVESFGENFQALDSAIGKMVAWQESYRQSVDTFERMLGRTMETTRESSEALLELFRSASVEYRAAFEALSASLQESADKNLEVIQASASEVYRNFDELMKVQQHLETMTRNYERMAEIADRLERDSGNREG